MDSLIIQDVFEPYYAGRDGENKSVVGKPDTRLRVTAKPAPRRLLKAAPHSKKAKKAEH